MYLYDISSNFVFILIIYEFLKNKEIGCNDL